MSAEALARFLPRSVVAHLASLPTAPAEPREQLLEAAVMLADVSGFTALAERLARQGPSGAELLTQTLNAFFDPLIDRIHASGGDVLKFAGDAMVVQWPHGAGGAREAVQRAASCGLALQAYAEDPARGAEGLHLKVAIGDGSLRLQHIGGWKNRWEVLVTGEGLSSLAEITPLAKPGQVVLTTGAHDALASGAQGTLLGEAGFLLEHLDVHFDPVTSTAALLPEAERMVGYLPEAVIAGGLGQDGWLSELRPVSVVFINFPNATYRTPLERAHGIMRLIQQVLERYEGAANKISVDEKGVSAVAVFGTPPHAHADDPARAVLAARAIHAQFAQLQVHHATGIASGTAFCGVVGGAHRREYTVLGDTVNLAARLMQAAKGDLFCDATTAQRARTRLHFEPLPPLTVKGKAEPVAAFRPGEELVAGIQEVSPLLGRVAEMDALQRALGAARPGAHAPPILIEGEAGLGKSRLMVEAERLCEERQLPHLSGAGDPVERDTPYFAWRSIFEHLLDIVGVDEGQRAGRAEAALAKLGLADRAPLLNPLLALDLPETAATTELKGTVRGENTRDLLVRLLEAHSRAGPLALLIEDAHWLDGASWGLAVLARHRAPDLLFVFTSRPPEPPELVERRTLLSEAVRISLGPLAPEEAVALACQRLQVPALPELAAQLVRERGGGHPYFSEELAYALRDSGILRFVDGEAVLADDRPLGALQLPASIQGVIAQRVDRLPAELKITLKTASVIGRTFSNRTLAEVHPAHLGTAELARHLGELARLDLTPMEGAGDDRTYAFKHALTREAVYGSVLVATRRELHGAVAAWYERHHAGSLAAHAALLAHHWIQAGDNDRGRYCLELAGEQALGSGAPREALLFLEDAIARESITTDPPLARGHRRRLWGEALLDSGRLNEARQALEGAVALLGWPMPRAKTQWALSFLGHAARQLGHRASLPEVIPPGRDVEAEAARSFERLGLVCFFQNQPEGTLFSTLASVNLSEVSLPRRERARAYADLTMGCSLLPARALAVQYERLARLALSERASMADEAWARMILGMVHAGQGSWEIARSELERSREIQARLGDHRRHSETGMIVALLQWLAGDLAGARATSEGVLEAGCRASDLHMQSGANAHVAYCLLRTGELTEARQHLEKGARCADEAAAVPEQVYTRGLLALSRVLEGRMQEACAELERVVALLPGLLPTAVYALEGYGAVACAALRAREADPRGVARLKGALRGLRAYARTFPIAGPRLLRYEGHLPASLRRATELQLPLDAALTTLQLDWSQRGSPTNAAEIAAREQLARVTTEHERRQIANRQPLLMM